MRVGGSGKRKLKNTRKGEENGADLGGGWWILRVGEEHCSSAFRDAG